MFDLHLQARACSRQVYQQCNMWYAGMHKSNKTQQAAGRANNAKAALTHACRDDKQYTQLSIKPIERCSLLYPLIPSGATAHTSSAWKTHLELLRGKIFSHWYSKPKTTLLRGSDELTFENVLQAIRLWEWWAYPSRRGPKDRKNLGRLTMISQKMFEVTWNWRFSICQLTNWETSISRDIFVGSM
jgi:hypothetical protein